MTENVLPSANARSGLLLSSAAVAVVLALVLLVDHLRTRATGLVTKVHEQGRVYVLPPPEYVLRASLGHREQVASLLWAEVLYEYGEAMSRNVRYPHGPAYVDTITTLDENFLAAYRFLSAIVTMQPANPDRIELLETRRLYQRGMEQHPNDPTVWGTAAAFLLFDGSAFLSPDEVKAWRKDGAVVAQRAVELGYANDTLSVVGSIMLEKAGERELAIANLERAYSVATDDQNRATILRRLRGLRKSQFIEAIERQRDDTRNAWAAEAPFVPWTTYLVLHSLGSTPKPASPPRTETSR